VDEGCHYQWKEFKHGLNCSEAGFHDTDVYVLFGFRDAWAADWHQQIRLEPCMIEFYYVWR